MDPSLFKDHIVTRGLNYHYYRAASKSDQPTLLFVHGFPSTCRSWHHQIKFFEELGYGIIAPDMLGYGGTAKPTDTPAYRSMLMCKDIIEILDTEGVEKAVAIGHDWGSVSVSRLANLYPTRFTGFAFLAVSYIPPNPDYDLEKILAMTKSMLGYEIFGYWKFFAEQDADKVIDEHWDSFISILMPDDPKNWITDFAPTGAAKAYLLANKTGPLASWLTEEDRRQLDGIRKDGFAGPLCWYKATLEGLEAEDEKQITASPITSPVLYLAASNDAVCLPMIGKQNLQGNCPNATVHDVPAAHWIMQEAPGEVNARLLEWIKGI